MTMKLREFSINFPGKTNLESTILRKYEVLK